jgi:Ni,Fe-hydrogenase III small subunit
VYYLLKQIAKTGIVTEPPPQADPSLREIEQRLSDAVLEHFGRALAIRHVDAGSCNGCELEIHACNSPHYNLERLGIRFVASPRHADMLLVTGPVSRNMEEALRRTYEATPEPKLVVAVGECGCNGGIFGENYASRGAVSNVIPVDVAVPGCPPEPTAIIQAILTAVSRASVRR